MMLGLPREAWTAIGFAGQGLFTARFLVQWLASERKGESIVPRSFWWLSVSGSAVLAVFAAAIEDPVFLLGSLVNGFLYARNLILIYFVREKPTSRRVLVPTVLALGAFLFYAIAGRLDRSIPTVWLVVGFAGAALWSGRFMIQWYASERAGRSVVPRSFWYVGLAGAFLLLSYSVLRREPVFILAYLFPPFPYIRNLVLIYRKEGAPGPVRWGQRVWREPRSRTVAIAVFAVLLAAFLAVRVGSARKSAGGFLGYYRAARIVIDGDIMLLYEDDAPSAPGFRPLPGVAVALAPLGLLPPRVAEVGWAWINAFCFLMTLAVACRFTRGYGVRAAWMWVPFLLVLRFGWDCMNHGEIHPATVLLITGGLALAETGRPSRGGFLAGLAAAVNPVLLLMGAVFAVRRSFLAAAWLAAGFCMVAFLVPAMVAGPEQAARLGSNYLESRGVPVVTDGGAEHVSGVSLRAISYRLLGSVPLRKSGEALDVSSGLLDEAGSRAAFLVLAGILAVGVLSIAARRRDEKDAPLVWGIALCGVLLLTPKSRPPHFLMLMLPATAVVMVLARAGLRRTRAKVMLALLAAAFVLAAIPSRGIVGPRVALWFFAFCAVGFAAMSLLLATALALVDDQTPEAG